MGIAMLSGPFIAGILMTSLTDGREGLNELFTRMTKWGIGRRWYVPPAIFPTLLSFTSLILSVVVSTELAPTFFAFGILMGLLAGFLEETGWMGFAFPRMSLKGSLLNASIYLGFIHGFRHITADFLGNFNTLGRVLAALFYRLFCSRYGFESPNCVGVR